MAHSYTAHTIDYPDSVSWFNPGGDDYEERMRLENTIQVPDISLSSSQASDVEYPRHMPESQLHSIDSGIYPYDNEEDNEGITLSTIAHHISGITLSPGFASRATPTMSDYDASRPVANLDLRQAKVNLSTFTYPRPTLSTTLKDKKFSPKRPSKPTPHGADKENEPPVAATPQTRASRKRAQNPSSVRKSLRLPDITGITAGVSSPGKPASPSHSDPPSQRRLVDALTKQLEAITKEALLAKSKVLQLETELEKRRQREQELSIDYRWSPNSRDLATLKEITQEKRALESLVESLRSHQERLEQTLQDRSYELAQCRAEILHQQETISDLRSQLSRAKDKVWNKSNQERSLEIQRLREEISRLERECIYLRGCVEKGLASIADKQSVPSNVQNQVPIVPAFAPVYHATSRTSPVIEVTEPITSRLETHVDLKETSRLFVQDPAISRAGATAGDRTARDTMLVQEDEISRVQSDIGERRSARSQSMQEGSPIRPTTVTIRAQGPSVIRPPSSRSHRPRVEDVLAPVEQGKSETRHYSHRLEKSRDSRETPFPQIRGEHMERLFFSAPPHDEHTCFVCHRKKPASLGTPSWLRAMQREKKEKGKLRVAPGVSDGVENVQNTKERDRPPPQAVLIKVLRELEDDFTHYKSIYCELADQYKLMNGTSNVAKRNVLAEHLTEVIRVLEKKGDQIASLYELLAYKDMPLIPQDEHNTHATTSR